VILITVSNRILIAGGGGRFVVVVVVSVEDLDESSNVSPGLIKPCVILFKKNEILLLNMKILL
jgi:hypothetical protein